MIDQVKKQYNDYPYPEPIDDLKSQIDKGYREESDLKISWPILFPEKKYQENIDIFIAGCGTNQAIYHALLYPNSNIYAIDLSENSISHNKKMIEKYNIKNIEIEEKSIFDIDIRDRFDLVISTGVIHHTKDPNKALKKLVLSGNNDSAIHIMVYSLYARIGIHFVQDVFKYLELDQNINDLEFAKNFIFSLPDNHYVNNFGGFKEINETSLVDTFLHTQDIHYDCLEIERLIKDSGGFFQCWYNNIDYYPFFLKLTEDKKEKLNNLSQFEIADLTQKIITTTNKHTFILRKKKEFKNIWHNPKKIKDNTIIRKNAGFKRVELANKENNYGGKIKNNRGMEISFSFLEGAIFHNIKNEKVEINALLDLVNSFLRSLNYDHIFELKELVNIIHDFWKKGLIILTIPSS